MENLHDYAQLMAKLGYLEGLTFVLQDEDIYEPVRQTIEEMRTIIDRVILGDGIRVPAGTVSEPWKSWPIEITCNTAK